MPPGAEGVASVGWRRSRDPPKPRSPSKHVPSALISPRRALGAETGGALGAGIGGVLGAGMGGVLGARIATSGGRGGSASMRFVCSGY